jgi:hypothetical protein
MPYLLGQICRPFLVPPFRSCVIYGMGGFTSDNQVLNLEDPRNAGQPTSRPDLVSAGS